MKLTWYYLSPKHADLYDEDKGVRVGLVHESLNGDCVAMALQSDGVWQTLLDKLPFIKAKHLVETVARLS